MDGGTLDIEWREADGHVYMTGPASFAFDGEATLPD
jgi:diaminopimelate epimerase